MLKGYVSRWKAREKPEQHIMDYCFDPRPENAAHWGSREDAEKDCVLFNNHQIVVPSSMGGNHTCKDFKVEQRAPNEFVVFCVAPFILEASGQGEKHQQRKP
jgi:hypothetical protein